MARSIGVGVVAILGVVGMVAARSAAQQMPRDRTTSDQRATERAAFDRKAAELEQAAAQQPGSAQAQHLVASFYYEKARDVALSAEERRGYIDRGVAAEDRALAADPDYVEALVYKNILLRTRATMESDPAVQAALVREADALRSRALEIAQAQRAKAIPEGTLVNTNVPPPPPPPPPPPRRSLGADQVGLRGDPDSRRGKRAGQDQGRPSNLRADGDRERVQGRGRRRGERRRARQGRTGPRDQEPADAHTGGDRRRAAVGVRSGNGPSRRISHHRHGQLHAACTVTALRRLSLPRASTGGPGDRRNSSIRKNS